MFFKYDFAYVPKVESPSRKPELDYRLNWYNAQSHEVALAEIARRVGVSTHAISKIIK